MSAQHQGTLVLNSCRPGIRDDSGTAKGPSPCARKADREAPPLPTERSFSIPSCTRYGEGLHQGLTVSSLGPSSSLGQIVSGIHPQHTRIAAFHDPVASQVAWKNLDPPVEYSRVPCHVGPVPCGGAGPVQMTLGTAVYR